LPPSSTPPPPSRGRRPLCVKTTATADSADSAEMLVLLAQPIAHPDVHCRGLSPRAAGAALPPLRKRGGLEARETENPPWQRLREPPREPGLPGEPTAPGRGPARDSGTGGGPAPPALVGTGRVNAKSNFQSAQMPESALDPGRNAVLIRVDQPSSAAELQLAWRVWGGARAGQIHMDHGPARTSGGSRDAIRPARRPQWARCVSPRRRGVRRPRRARWAGAPPD